MLFKFKIWRICFVFHVLCRGFPPLFSACGTLMCYGLLNEAEGGVAVDVTVRRK